MAFKKTSTIAFIVFLHYIPYICHAAGSWKIISTTPPDKKIDVHEGDRIRLIVTANAYIRKCVWIHTGSKKACEFKYVHAVNKLVKQNTCQLDDHEGRVHVAGNYDNHECGMKISEAIPSDAGEWRVEVKEYIDKNPITFFTANPATDNRKFQVNVTAKIVSQTEIIKGTTLAPLLLVPKINDQNTVIGSPLSGNHEEENGANSSGSSNVMAIVGGICGLLALIAVLAFVGYKYRKQWIAMRNPSVKFSDVYPREDDDDKTWRGDDSWRANTDGNHYSEPPGNVSLQLPINDEETNVAIPQNEKALEKMGELHSVKYSGARRVL